VTATDPLPAAGGVVSGGGVVSPAGGSAPLGAAGIGATADAAPIIPAALVIGGGVRRLTEVVSASLTPDTPQITPSAAGSSPGAFASIVETMSVGQPVDPRVGAGRRPGLCHLIRARVEASHDDFLTIMGVDPASTRVDAEPPAVERPERRVDRVALKEGRIDPLLLALIGLTRRTRAAIVPHARRHTKEIADD
jgi:hypothetical protein